MGGEMGSSILSHVIGLMLPRLPLFGTGIFIVPPCALATWSSSSPFLPSLPWCAFRNLRSPEGNATTYNPQFLSQRRHRPTTVETRPPPWKACKILAAPVNS